MAIARRHFLLTGLSAMLGACSATVLPRGTDPSTLTISAAASLQNVLAEIKREYERQRPDVTLIFNFGSSGALQHQIEQGAAVDVFISAASRQMDRLEAQNLLLPNTRRILLRNQMVLVTALHRQGVKDFADLKSDRVGTIAIGQPDSVPAGQYAKEILISLDLYEPVREKLVLGQDVRQVLSYVETGNVDAGLVYASDALMSDRMTVVATAKESWHSPIVYPVAAIAPSHNPQLARGFIQFLARDSTQHRFATYGFQPFQAIAH